MDNAVSTQCRVKGRNKSLRESRELGGYSRKSFMKEMAFTLDLEGRLGVVCAQMSARRYGISRGLSCNLAESDP